MTIAQMDEAKKLLNDRSLIQGKIESLKEVYAIDFYKSGGGKVRYEEYSQSGFWSDLNKEVIDSAREAAALTLINTRDSLTAKLKELGLEE